MKRVAGFAISVLSLCLLLSCDSEKDQYAGLADIVAERNEARETIAKENQQKQNSEGLWEDENETSDLSSDRMRNDGKPVSSVVVYEKQIEIWDSEAKRPLASGVAYMNKSGQIVKIKVYRK